MTNFSHVHITLITHVNYLTNFSHITSRLITCNHYIKSTYEITMFVLTKMKFKLIIINNVMFVVCQNGHGYLCGFENFDYIVMLVNFTNEKDMVLL
jgi:hypothetical protein